MKKDTKAITVKRGTSESRIELTLADGPRDEKFKKRINTPLQFFNHMLETISWRACVNIAVEVELPDFKLTHVICEDVGLSLGEAFIELFNREIEKGINGSGAGTACIDEAAARAIISFEERALLVIDEIGSQYGTDAEKIMVSEIINDRYNNQLPTIIIGNVTMSEAENYLGARAIDRIKDNGFVAVFDWESHRKCARM